MRLRIAFTIVAAAFIGCGPREATNDKGTPPPAPSSAQGMDGSVRLEDVKQIVARQFKVDAGQLDVNRPIVEYGDELNVIEVVMTLEERYRVKIPDERFMDKAARGVGIHKDLTTTKLVGIVQRELPQ
jgi:acyl carrier protein